MSRIGPGQVRDAITRQTVFLTQFVEIQIPGEPLYLNPHGVNFTWNNKTWLGARGLGSISPVKESPGSIPGIELTMSGVDKDNLKQALDPNIRGSSVLLYLVALSPNHTILPNPVLNWIGFVDRAIVSVDNGVSQISLACEHITLKNKLPRTWRYTHEDQQILFPPDANNAEDRGFEFVTQMVERTLVWPARSFFEKQVRSEG